jgi:hypothetical protein
MEMPKSMRNIGKYADNVMNVMRENAHIHTLKIIYSMTHYIEKLSLFYGKYCDIFKILKI